jgi:hypothetical protein
MSTSKTKKELSLEQREELLSLLKALFEKNMSRHKGLKSADEASKMNTSF